MFMFMFSQTLLNPTASECFPMVACMWGQTPASQHTGGTGWVELQDTYTFNNKTFFLNS